MVTDKPQESLEEEEEEEECHPFLRLLHFQILVREEVSILDLTLEVDSILVIHRRLRLFRNVECLEEDEAVGGFHQTQTQVRIISHNILLHLLHTPLLMLLLLVISINPFSLLNLVQPLGHIHHHLLQLILMERRMTRKVRMKTI